MPLGMRHHRAGAGEPLLALHGIGSAWEVWRPVLPMLEEHHEVIALSLPGFGGSPPLEGEPTVHALTDAVERAMDEAGLDTAHIAGNSMGGFIGAELAARGRARTLVGLSPAGLYTPRESAYATRTLQVAYTLARALAPHAERIVRNRAGKAGVLGLAYARPDRMSAADAADSLRALAGSPSFPRTVRDLRTSRPRGLDAIRVPVRVIWGRSDRLLPRRQGPRWTRVVPGAELLELPGVGHVPMGDDPEMAAAKILEVTAPASAPRARAAAPA